MLRALEVERLLSAGMPVGAALAPGEWVLCLVCLGRRPCEGDTGLWLRMSLPLDQHPLQDQLLSTWA